MTAPQTKSAAYDVGYGKPPRHTQFRKGQSGNPGGRPRGAPIERLKALTLAEAYRGVVIKENGIAVPVQAVQAILRSQIELAMNGNVRAQRDILNAVRTYERADAEAAALEAYVEELVRQAADLKAVLEAIEETERVAPVEKRMSYVEAAERIRQLLAEAKARCDAADSETGAPGNETVTQERDVGRTAAVAAPSADNAPQPENGTTPAALPVASTRTPSADPPAAPPADPRPWRPRADRYASHPARESTPSPVEDSRARFLRNRCLYHGTGNSAQPFDVTWNEVTSWQRRPRKSGNSLLNSLFSGNAGTGRAEGAPATTGKDNRGGRDKPGDDGLRGSSINNGGIVVQP